MTNVYVTATDPLSDNVQLETRTFDVHIVRGKFGPQLPSVFEIQKAIVGADEIQRSRKNAEARIYIADVGRIGSAAWRTVVIATLCGARLRNVSTAYNVYGKVAKGEVIWPQESEVSQ
jgi:hypothetical protein